MLQLNFHFYTEETMTSSVVFILKRQNWSLQEKISFSGGHFSVTDFPKLGAN